MSRKTTGYGLYLKNGKVQVNLVLRWLDDGARVETVKPVALNRWHHVLVTYDGSRTAEGIKIYVDGQPQELTVHLDDLNQIVPDARAAADRRGWRPENRFHGPIDDVRIYDVALTPQHAAVVATGESIDRDRGHRRRRRRSEPQAEKLTLYFLDNHAPAPKSGLAWRAARRQVRRAEGAFCRRPSDRHGDAGDATRRATHSCCCAARTTSRARRSTPGVPAVLPPLPQGEPNNRLGFARWLVDPSNPLTARVAVNRFWQMYFGTGLVKTVEDFGSQGEWPSHPELLDWLATEFVRTGWDVKAMQKTDRHERDLSAVLEGDAGAAAEGSREPAAGARAAVPAAGRDDPRSGAGGRRACWSRSSAARR